MAIGIATTAFTAIALGSAPTAQAAVAPTAGTGTGSPTSETHATLAGLVNPNGSTVSVCYFEYGRSATYELAVPCEQTVGEGSEPVAVTATVGGLAGGTTYHFRVVAANATGAGFGADHEFAMPLPPMAETFYANPGFPSFEGSTSATFEGIVFSNGSVVTLCQFEYGVTPGFSLTVPCAETVGTGEAVRAHATATGLSWGTNYDVRLVATSLGGTSYGKSVAFRTANQLVLSPPVLPFVSSWPELPQTTATEAVSGALDRPVTAGPAGRRKPSPALTKCLKRHGTARARCLAALNGYNPNDVGLYVAYCPRRSRAAGQRAFAASTSEKGWPPKECLKMDKGPAGLHHTIVGQRGIHNWLLGGYGNDTIIGGDLGDVIWADYHPNGEPKRQTAIIHAGNGVNVIYANDTMNYVWTGSNAKTVVHAHVSGVSGVIHCGSNHIVIYLSTTSEKHFTLNGCGPISHYSVGY